MSLMGRLVGGAAQAGAAISMRYVDDQIATQRAQMLADLQRTTAGRIREDDDAYRNDPTRVQRDRERRAGDIEAEGVTRRGVEKAELGDADLQAARRGKADSDADAEIKRKLAAGEALLPYEVKRAGLIADANAKATAKYREPKEGANDPFVKLPAPVKAAYASLQKEAEQINAEIVKAKAADGGWNPKANPGQAELDTRLRVVRDKAQTLIGKYMKPEPGAEDPDKAIRALLLGADDVKPAAPGAQPTAKPAAKPIMQRAEEANKDPISALDERTLARIAAIPGHAKQKEAQAELARRKANAPELDTTGFGFGNPGA